MALKLRLNNVASPGYPDREDYSVMSNELVVGRIYEVRTGPKDLRWFWVINGVHAPLTVVTT
jgi:hypothetical protein